MAAAIPMQAPPVVPTADVSTIQGTYETGALANAGILSSPPITLLSGYQYLHFDDWYEVEPVSPDIFDLRYVLIQLVNGIHIPDVDGQSGVCINLVNDPSSREWGHNVIDLYYNGFMPGDQVIVSFVFDTRDGVYNDYKGWFIDNVNIGGTFFSFDDGLDGWHVENLGHEFMPLVLGSEEDQHVGRTLLDGASIDGDTMMPYYKGTSLWHHIVCQGEGMMWYGKTNDSWSPVSLKPLVDTQLGMAQDFWSCISESLPEDMSDDVLQSIELVNTHMANASSISNAIYAGGQIAKAVTVMEQIMAELGISCE